MFAPADVILAIASPPGRSLRGMIRISGAGTRELLRDCLDLHQFARGAHFAQLRLDRFSIPTIAMIMVGPHSYTGEDSAELQLPGNPALLERVVADLAAHARHKGISARRAEPGEYTARAFFNGRISLTQAEGVAATIAAQSDAELRAASHLRRGTLGDFAHQLADDLASALALVEAGIDFTDQEDVIAIAPADLHTRLTGLRQRIDDHLSRAVGMEQLESIPWVALVGKPNSGKSSLFNALLGHERAVVSPVSGTTRDVLAEPLAVETAHGLAEVMLVDLAGLDEEESSINQLMQSAAAQAIERSELILRCVPVDENVGEIKAHEVVVRTKADLLENRLSSRESNGPGDSVTVSAFSGRGLNDLRRVIAQRLADRAVSLAADAAALRPRHEAALRSALANIGEAVDLVEPLRHERSLGYPELIASTMRAALDDLAALAGDISPDEVLGRVFATFCVGK